MGINYLIPKIKVSDTVVYQTSLFSSNDKIILAPLQNLTNYYFRQAYNKFFPNTIDYAITPFISANEGIEKENKAKFRDVWKKNNENCIDIIPQILGNKAEQVLSVAKILEQMGYRKVNINLGCPKKEVVNKHRGAGLLENVEEIDRIINEIMTKTKMQLSLKVRLGNKKNDELQALIPTINNYPIDFVAIHARLAEQMYEGNVDVESFQKLSAQIKTKVIYNGDIFSVEDFRRLKMRFPYINDWMLGRGVLRNPFLCGEIRGIYFDKKQIYPQFFHQLLNNFMEYSKNDEVVVNKMKEYCKYFCVGLKKDSTKILHAVSLSQIVSEFETYL